MKKHWVIYFTCATLLANAASKPPQKPCHEPAKSCEAQKKSCPKPVPYDADLFRRDTPVYSFHGSFLFWRVQEGALDYALKMEQTGPASSPRQGEMEKATFNGEPGFRVAASISERPNTGKSGCNIHV